MDLKTINELGGALQRIAELSQKKIIESGDAGERRAQEAFVKDTLYANASELVGAWITIQNAYRPLVTGFTALLRTSLRMIEREQQQQQQQQTPTEAPTEAAPAAAPDNIIPLPTEGVAEEEKQ